MSVLRKDEEKWFPCRRLHRPTPPTTSRCTHLQGYFIKSQSTDGKIHTVTRRSHSSTHLHGFIDEVSAHTAGQYENPVMQTIF